MIHKFLNQLYSSGSFQEVDYEVLIRMIEKEGVAPQIYSKLVGEDRLKETPSFFQERLLEAYQTNRYSSIFIKYETDRILNHCEKLHYEVMPLKGVYFAEEYFDHFSHRNTSDIDILIKKEQINDVVQLVKELGFSEEEAYIPDHFHSSFSKTLPHSPIPLTVEIHWALMWEDTSSIDMGDFWSQAGPLKGYSHVYTLSNPHCFYFMCLHAWRHNLDSAKHYLDLIQTLRHTSDEEIVKVLALAKRQQTYKRVIRTLAILYDTYPFLKKEHPILELPIPWFRKIEKYKWGQFLIFFDYQVLSYDSFRHRIKEAIRLVFASDSIWRRQLRAIVRNNKLVSRVLLHRQRTHD